MISVVIPALNEESSITSTIEGVRRVLEQANTGPIEIVVVDDGSIDLTGLLATQAGATVIRHLYSSGYGQALKDGIALAKYDTIVITDADGTYPPESIPALLEKYRQGYQLVVGERKGANLDETWFKKPLRFVLKLVVEFTAGARIPDVNSGLRVFSKAEVSQYFAQLCTTFSFTTSQTLAYLMTGKYVGYVPIEYLARSGSSKVRIFKDSLRTAQYIVQSILYYNPIKLFLLFCGVTLGFSILCFAVAFFAQLASAFLLGVGGVLVSFVIFSIGLLADQLRQIHLRHLPPANSKK